MRPRADIRLIVATVLLVSVCSVIWMNLDQGFPLIETKEGGRSAEEPQQAQPVSREDKDEAAFKNVSRSLIQSIRTRVRLNKITLLASSSDANFAWFSKEADNLPDVRHNQSLFIVQRLLCSCRDGFKNASDALNLRDRAADAGNAEIAERSEKSAVESLDHILVSARMAEDDLKDTH